MESTVILCIFLFRSTPTSRDEAPASRYEGTTPSPRHESPGPTPTQTAPTSCPSCLKKLLSDSLKGTIVETASKDQENIVGGGETFRGVLEVIMCKYINIMIISSVNKAVFSYHVHISC